jgi:CopG family nickel-responsive transcriptional regulator
MKRVARFGVSLDKALLEKFDKYTKVKKYSNRSLAISDLIRENLVKEEWTHGGEVAGAIAIVYDHHKRELVSRLMDIQHDYGHFIISAQHVHLDHHNCLEVVIVKGITEKVKELFESLRSCKGVKHGTLNMTTTGKEVR